MPFIYFFGGHLLGLKMEESEELGPAAAYSASVAEWLNQAYHAHMIQVREYRYSMMQRYIEITQGHDPFLFSVAQGIF
jgi:hypothetical protein